MNLELRIKIALRAGTNLASTLPGRLFEAPEPFRFASYASCQPFVSQAVCAFGSHHHRSTLRYILAHLPNCLAGDNLSADCRLDGDVELLPRDQVF